MMVTMNEIEEVLEKMHKFIYENRFDDKKYSDFFRSLPIDSDYIRMSARKNAKTINTILLMRAYMLKNNPDLTITDLLEREMASRKKMYEE